MTPFIPEILEEISKTPAALSKYKDNFAVRTVLEWAFDKTKKFALPEGEPPFKPDAAPIGMSPSNFYQQVKKLYIFQRTDISNVRREQLFIQLIEGLHPSEAKICIAIKDQNLTSLYPGITADLVVKAGIVTEENIFRTDMAPEGERLVVNITDTVKSEDKVGGDKATKSVETKEKPVKAAPKKRAPKSVTKQNEA